MEFTIGVKRIAPLWRLLDGIAAKDWTDAIDMHDAQVVVADYIPDWWPAATRPLIRRVRLDVAIGALSADPRSRRRRTLHPDQRVLPLDELANTVVYGYSLIMTNLDVSTGEKARPSSTGIGTGPRSRTSSATPSSAPPRATSPRLSGADWRWSVMSTTNTGL